MLAFSLEPVKMELFKCEAIVPSHTILLREQLEQDSARFSDTVIVQIVPI